MAHSIRITQPSGPITVNGGSTVQLTVTLRGTAPAHTTPTWTTVADYPATNPNALSTTWVTPTPSTDRTYTIYCDWLDDFGTDIAEDTVEITVRGSGIVTTPGVPGLPNVTTVDQDSISIAWTPVSGATGYDIRYRPGTSGGYTTLTGVTSPHQIDSLNASTLYQVQVRATNAGGNSNYSSIGSTTTSAPAAAAPSVSLTPPADNRVFGSRSATVPHWIRVTPTVSYSGSNTLSYTWTQTGGIGFSDAGTRVTHLRMPAETASEQRVTAKLTVTDTTTNRSDSVTLTLRVVAAPTNKSLFAAAIAAEHQQVAGSTTGVRWLNWTQINRHNDGSFSLVDSRFFRSRAGVQLPTSLIVGESTAYVSLIFLDNDGRMQFQLATEADEGNSGLSAGPQLTDTAESNLGLAWRLPDGTQYALEMDDLTSSDSTDPYRFTAASLTAAGATNNAAMRTKNRQFWSARLILVDRTSRNIDWPNLRTAIPTAAAPEPPTNVTANGIDKDSIQIQWEAPTTGPAPTSYTLRHRRTSSSNWTSVTGITTTNKEINNLRSDTEYKFQVKAVNSDGSSTWAPTSPATASTEPVTTASQVPSIPRRFQADAQSTGVVITWLEPKESGTGGAVNGYNLWRHDGAGWTEFVVNTGTTDTTYTDTTTLEAGKRYEYTMRARNTTGPGEWTSVIAVTINPKQPSEPRRLQADAQSTGVVLTWLKPVDDGLAGAVNGYNIWRHDGDSWTEIVVNTGSKTTRYTDTAPLIEGASYEYVIRARNTAGAGEWSAVVKVLINPQVPSAPRVLIVTETAAGRVLTWQAPVDAGLGGAISGYIILRHDGSMWVQTGTITGSTKEYTDTTTVAEGWHWYAVRAVNKAGTGEWSTPAGITTATNVPGPPTSLTATPTETGVNLTWEPPNDTGGESITGFRVWRSLGAAWTQLTSNAGITGRTYTDTAIPTLGQGIFYYRVNAVTKNGPGDFSAAAQVLITRKTPSEPQRFTADAQSTGVVISWEKPEQEGTGGAVTAYEIQRHNGTDWTSVVTTTGVVYTYTDTTDLVIGATYGYIIRAVNTKGAGKWSATVKVVINPDLPSEPRRFVTDSRSTGVFINWDLPVDEGASPINGFNLWRHDGEDWTEMVVNTGAVAAVQAAPAPTTTTFGVGTAKIGKFSAGMKIDIDGNDRKITTTNNTTGVITISLPLSQAPASGDRVTGISYIDTTTLTTGKRYEYISRAVNMNGNGEWSQSSKVLINPNVPTAPRRLAASDTANAVHLSWQAPEQDGGSPITGYEIYRWSGSGNWALVHTSTTTATAYSDIALLDDRWHWYYVRARNANGKGDPSQAIPINTNPHLPGPPQSLVIAETATGPRLSWLAPSSDGESPITGYKIWRISDASIQVGWPLVTTTGVVLTYTDTATLSPGNYWYRVAAVNENGHGDLAVAFVDTGDASVEPAELPNIPLFIEKGSLQLYLRWQQVINAATYKVEYKTAIADAWTQIGGNDLTTAHYSHTGLTAGTTYTYQVTALSSSGATIAQSNPVSALPLANLPRPHLTIDAGDAQLIVSWAPVLGAVKYDLVFWTKGNTSWAPLLDDKNQTTHVHTGLTNGQKYWYTARGVTAADAPGPWSKQALGVPGQSESRRPTPGHTDANLLRAQKQFSTRSRVTLRAHAWDDFRTQPYEWKVVQTERPSAIGRECLHDAIALRDGNILRAFTIPTNPQFYLQRVNPSDPANWKNTGIEHSYTDGVTGKLNVSNPVFFIAGTQRIGWIVNGNKLRYITRHPNYYWTVPTDVTIDSSLPDHPVRSFAATVYSGHLYFCFTHGVWLQSYKMNLTTRAMTKVFDRIKYWDAIGIRTTETGLKYYLKRQANHNRPGEFNPDDGSRTPSQIVVADLDETQGTDTAFSFDPEDIDPESLIMDTGLMGEYEDAGVMVRHARAQPAPGGGWHIWMTESLGLEYQSIGRLNEEDLIAEPTIYPEWGKANEKLDNPYKNERHHNAEEINEPLVTSITAPSGKAYLCAANWIAEGTPITAPTTTFKPTAYIYTRRVVGLGDTTIGIGEEGNTQLITPTSTVGMMRIDLDYADSGIKAGHLLEIERTMEAPDTEGGTGKFWMLAMKVKESPVTTVIEAVDAVAYLGMQRLRRTAIFRLPNETYGHLIKRIVAMGGIPLTMLDTSHHLLGAELTVQPNRHLRSIILDLSRLSQHFQLRPDHPTQFGIEIAPPPKESANDYKYGGDGNHKIIMPIRESSFVEPSLAIVSGSWNKFSIAKEPTDPYTRRYAWEIAAAQRTPGTRPRPIYTRNQNLFNRLRLARSAAASKNIMLDKKPLATIEVIANLNLNLHDLVKVTAPFLGYTDQTLQTNLIVETWDRALLLQSIGLGAPDDQRRIITINEGDVEQSEAVIWSYTKNDPIGRIRYGQGSLFLVVTAAIAAQFASKGVLEDTAPTIPAKWIQAAADARITGIELDTLNTAGRGRLIFRGIEFSDEGLQKLAIALQNDQGDILVWRLDDINNHVSATRSSFPVGVSGEDIPDDGRSWGDWQRQFANTKYTRITIFDHTFTGVDWRTFTIATA